MNENNNTQQIIPISLSSSFTNTEPLTNSCSYMEQISSVFISTSPVTISFGDAIQLEIVYDWAFDINTPFNGCTEIIQFTSTLYHNNSTISEGCNYLDSTFDDSYLYELNTLTVKRPADSPVNGEISENVFGPE